MNDAPIARAPSRPTSRTRFAAAVAWACAFGAASFSCSGRDGAPGAVGPSGDAGAAGPAGPPGPAAPSTGFVAGVVRSAEAALAGARAETVPLVADGGADSAADGRFRLGPLAVGLYRIKITKAGYGSRVLEVNVHGGETVALDVAMSPLSTGTIAGVVTFPGAVPAPRAAVSSDAASGRAITDARGAFTLEVPVGTHTVRASLLDERYDTVVANHVRVAPGAVVTVDLALVPGSLARATFVGSSACAECHASHVERWSASRHHGTVRYDGDTPDPSRQGSDPPWSGAFTLPRATGVSYGVELSREGGERRVTLVDAADARRPFTVARQHGGGSGHRQLFDARIGNLFFVLPLQWNEATRAFAAYDAERWFDAQGRAVAPVPSASVEQRCSGCHTTGSRVVRRDGGVVSAVSFVEGNVGCEACHGAGSRHVLSRSAADIFNPRRLLTRTSGVFDGAGALVDPEAYDRYLRANEACGQCHSRGISNGAADPENQQQAGAFDYPFADTHGEGGGYRVGEPLARYFADRPVRWSDTIYDHSRSARASYQQWSDLLEARADGNSHAQNARGLVACFDCHSPHGSALPAALRQTASDNTLCLSCHAGEGPFVPRAGEADADAARRHGGHFFYTPGADGQSRCTGCHMPRTAQRGGAPDVSSHTFRVVAPHETQRMRDGGVPAVPNSCNGCHPSEGDSGALRYELLFGPPLPVP